MAQVLCGGLLWFAGVVMWITKLYQARWRQAYELAVRKMNDEFIL